MDQQSTYVTFKDESDHENLPFQVKKLYKEESFYINDTEETFKKYQKEFQESLTMIEEWRIDNFSTSDKRYIPQIKQIPFPRLKHLFLNTGNVVSIEGLNRMNLPVLYELYLSFNQISSVREMKKLNFPQLSELLIHANKIYTGFYDFSHLPNNYFKILSTEHLGSESTFYIDISWIIKLKAKTIGSMWIMKETKDKRIERKEFEQVLYSKYPK